MTKARRVDSDVLIVGAGPVGLTLALLLARRGRTVVVYERWHEPYLLPRAVALSHDSVRTYQAAGVLDALMPHLDLETRERFAEFFDKSGEVLMRLVYPGVGESGYPPMNGFNQPDLEAVLERCCEEHPLITIRRGWSARAIDQVDDHVALTLAPSAGDDKPPGDSIVATAHFAVGCDGANSSIRSLAGIEMEDTGFQSSWLVVDIVPTVARVWDPEISQSLDPARPVTFAPSGRGRRRFEFIALPGETREALTDPAKVWELLGQWDVTPDNAELVRSAFYTFRGRWAERWDSGRVMLAGDAAHQMPPFLGQGFNSGVRDAVALAWRLDLALSGQVGTPVLESYGTERQVHVRQIVEQAVEIGRLICVTDPDAAVQRDAMLRHIRDHPELAPIPPEWRLGPGILMPDDPHAGYLSLQARIASRDCEGMLDDIVGTGRFLLLGNGFDPSAGLDAATRAAWDKVGGVGVDIGGQDGFRDVDGAYAAWFEKLGAAVALVRPDFQIFGATADRIGAVTLVHALVGQLELRL